MKSSATDEQKWLQQANMISLAAVSPPQGWPSSPSTAAQSKLVRYFVISVNNSGGKLASSRVWKLWGQDWQSTTLHTASLTLSVSRTSGLLWGQEVYQHLCIYLSVGVSCLQVGKGNNKPKGNVAWQVELFSACRHNPPTLAVKQRTAITTTTSCISMYNNYTFDLTNDGHTSLS